MKTFFSKYDPGKIWAYVFILFFISVPINLFSNGITGALVLFFACAFVAYKFDIPKFSLVLFLLALVLRVAVVLIMPAPAISDFGVLLDASRDMINGDNSYLETPYFQLWSYQLGFVFFQSLFLRIWNDMLILKLLNCVLSAATVVLVYLISKEFVGRRIAQTVSLLYCCLPFTVTYVTILSNQFISSFLVYLGMYIIVAKKIKLHSHLKYLIFALLLALANVMRPESIIPLAAAVFFLVLTLEKGNIRENLINIAVLVGTYLLVVFLMDKLFEVTGIAPAGLVNNDPLWKFVLGLNHETGGRYTDADSIYLNNSGAALEVIKNRLFVPVSELMDLFGRKIKTFWVGSSNGWTFNTFLSNGITVMGKTVLAASDVSNVTAMMSWVMIFVYVLIIIGILGYLRHKEYNKHMYLFLNQAFITFVVYLLIEVQPRYIYHIQISAVILASLGIYEIVRFLNRLKINSDQTDRS